MNKPLRLSHSAVTTHSLCSFKYKLHYLERLRPIKQGSALVFGSAIDSALNDLLVTKDLKQAVAIYDKALTFASINGVQVYVPTCLDVTYSQKDFDSELLEDDDFAKFSDKFKFEDQSKEAVLDFADECLKAKKSKHYEMLEESTQQAYSYLTWLCLRRKGMILLKGYYDQILPRIKEVLSTQKTINLENDQGDSVIGFLDLAVIWEDGKRYILDNKTASQPYPDDAIQTSQQLALYYHAEKEEMKLDGAGYIVMLKDINKNRTKICTSCGFDGSTGRHKSCPNEVNEKRCNGEYKGTIRPEAKIQVMLGEVIPEAEDAVIDTFDLANEGIKAGIFEKNLNSCFNPFPCSFRNLCHRGSYDGLVKLNEKDKV